MKLIISGATGFIGSHLVPKLVKAGYVIGILVRSTSNFHSIQDLKSVNLLNCDSYLDIYNSFIRFRPDAVLHLATLYKNAHIPNDIPELLHSNIEFGINILEVMSQCGVRKIINFGTRWQHLDNVLNHPANLYAATKNAFYDILMYYHYSHRIEYTILELCDTYGKDDPRKKVVEIMANACKDRIPLQLSPGEQVLDIVSIDDLVDYIMFGLSHDEFFHNDIYAISGDVISLKDLGEKIEKIFGEQGFLKWGEKPYRESEIMSPPVFHEIKKINREPLETQLIKQFR